jgi:hypothetical protein
MRIKRKPPLLLIVIIGLFFLTYGRWELFTLIKGKEFTEAVTKNAPICYLYESQFDIDYIKVMSLWWGNARVFLRVKDGNTYFIDFKKIDGEWQVFYDDICHYDIIKSAIGGSADGWYWYW